jgi:predicted DNA-binding transcriptional regulator YafY
MRADRLLSLMLLLQTRGRMTARELADKLEVSERTIYRDLDALGAAGIPVYGDHGPGGGYALLDSYRTNLTGLTEDEVRALFMGGAHKALADLGLAEASEVAQLKLSASLPTSQLRDAEHMRQRILFDAAGWFQPQESVPHLQLLQEAIWHDRQVYIAYHRADGSQGERLINPLGLVAKATIWYLVASIGDEMRVYRVSRIKGVAICEECFERASNFDLAAYWSQWSAEFEANRPQYKVTLRLAPEMATLLPQIWGEGVRKRLEEAEPSPIDGWVEAIFTFESVESARTNVMGLGTQAEVVEPLELREAIAEMAQAIAKFYGRNLPTT